MKISPVDPNLLPCISCWSFASNGRRLLPSFLVGFMHFSASLHFINLGFLAKFLCLLSFDFKSFGLLSDNFKDFFVIASYFSESKKHPSH